VFDAIFAFLFKYEPLVFEQGFQQGRFVLAASRQMWLTAGLATLIAAYALWTYRQLAAVTGRDRAILLAIRIPLLALALFVLLRPTLELKVAVPQQNFVGILLDDSRSMQVADHDGKPRSDFVMNELGRPDARLLTELGKRFQLRVYRFSSSAERLQSTGDLRFEGTGTRLGEAFDRARDELSGLPVAGLVVVTDGSDNSTATLDEAIAGLKAQAMPVFPVGVGRERMTRDVQVTRVETPRRTLKGSSLVLDLVISQTGYAGTKVPLIVEDEGRIVSSQDITLPGDGESETVKVRLKTMDTGSRVFKFRVPVQSGEEVAQNNQREAHIEVFDRTEKILLVDGEPRPEPKFVRLAIENDKNLQVVLLQRTAEATATASDKFLRVGVDNGEELAAGFPTSREELFAYRGLVLGSVEASAFTPEQQRMIEDFVDVRGGGLLVLGGARSFSEGGWAGTPLADALPVVLDRMSRAAEYPPVEEIVVKPTRAGLTHPATQIADAEKDVQAKWRDLPPLTSVNPVVQTKPGANVLLTGTDGRGRDQVVFAYQRYGRGRAIALPVQDTWLWRMHAKMDVKDMTHHTFWQRLLRWVVDGVPDRVMVSVAPDRVQKGEPVTLTAEVMDPEFKGINDGRITARVTSPSGKTEDVPMEWTVEHAGEYRARFTPTEDGIYKVSAGGTSKDGKDTTRGTSVIRVAPSDAEYFDAAMRAPLLKRVAEETEGRFYTPADAGKLVDAITYSGKGVTVVEERDLWDMPIILIGLLALMGGEWLLRRRRGLA
jgi:uncharacterized membrane protein